MATKPKDTSHGKEKIASSSSSSSSPSHSTLHQHNIEISHGRSSSRTSKSSIPTSPDKVHGVGSEKAIPNYLKHTMSSSKDPTSKMQQQGKKPVPSIDSSTSPRFTRRKSFDKPPSPAKLQRTLSSNSRERTPIKPSSPSLKTVISPKPISTISSKPVSEKITISPKTVTDRTSKTPRCVKAVQPVSTKPMPIKRTSSNTSSKNGRKASPSPSVASSTAPTSPETMETSVFEAKHQEDKVILEQEVLEQEILKVEEEEEIPFEIPPDHDQILNIDHIDYESPRNLEIEKPITTDTPALLEEQEQQEEELVLVPPTPQIEETQEKTIEPVQNQNQHEDEEEQLMDINEDKKDIDEFSSEKQFESNTVSESQDKTEAAEAEVEDENKTTLVKPIVREERTGSMGENSEENKPYKLKFQQVKELEVQAEDEAPQKLKFKEREVVKEEELEAAAESENVVLKRQDVKGKKENQAYNDVIEETASKLVEKRKSKVLALVGAFETVISLQEPEGQ